MGQPSLTTVDPLSIPAGTRGKKSSHRGPIHTYRRDFATFQPESKNRIAATKTSFFTFGLKKLGILVFLAGIFRPQKMRSKYPG
jgi:hypothetical protein